MDRNQAKEFYPILQAYAEGKVIECRTKPSFIEGLDVPNNWMEMKEVEYWNNTEYRIKPDSKAKAKYRPFANVEECWQEMLKHQPFGWVKNNNLYRNILETSDGAILLPSFPGEMFVSSFNKAKEKFTFADGIPFGVKVEE
jgi:hypothetical protein